MGSKRVLDRGHAVTRPHVFCLPAAAPQSAALPPPCAHDGGPTPPWAAVDVFGRERFGTERDDMVALDRS